MANYNLTNITDSTNYVNLIIRVNDMTDQYFGLFFIIALFIILFVNLKMYPTSRAFVTASFICTIVALLLRSINFVPDIALITLVIMTIIGTLTLWKDTE